MTNYLDDYLFVKFKREACNRLVRKFLSICRQINFPVALDKTEGADTKMIFLGILIDGESRTLCVPEEKRLKALHMLKYIGQARKATVRQLQSLAGTLNFINKAIHPGRAFTRRMYAKFSFASANKTLIHYDEESKSIEGEKQPSVKGCKLKPYHHVTLDKEFRFDCLVWEFFLANRQIHQNLCRPLADLEGDWGAEVLDFYSDASLCATKGYACDYNTNWLYEQWPPNFIKDCKPSIAFAELFAVCVGIFTWTKDIQNRKIIVFCDNLSVCNMLNHITSGCSNCMYLIRLVTLENFKHNRRLFVHYVKSRENVFADSLSRLDFNTFWSNMVRKKLKMNALPTGLPAIITPVTKIWNNAQSFTL